MSAFSRCAFQPWRGRMRAAVILGCCAALAACAMPKATPYDYTAFKQSRPASVVILPPINETTDIKAGSGVMSSSIAPLAEAGYYVMPASLVEATFRENGLTVADDVHGVAPARLHAIFGADAALYMKIKRYGTTYQIIGSETSVSLEAKMVDLRSGKLLWEGSASASSAEGRSSNAGGLTGLLVGAVIKQIVNTATDASYDYATLANERLLGARQNGSLFGPRSASYQKD